MEWRRKTKQLLANRLMEVGGIGVGCHTAVVAVDS